MVDEPFNVSTVTPEFTFVNVDAVDSVKFVLGPSSLQTEFDGVVVVDTQARNSVSLSVLFFLNAMMGDSRNVTFRVEWSVVKRS